MSGSCWPRCGWVDARPLPRPAPPPSPPSRATSPPSAAASSSWPGSRTPSSPATSAAVWRPGLWTMFDGCQNPLLRHRHTTLHYGRRGGHNWSQHLYIFLPSCSCPPTNHTLHRLDLDFWFHLTPFWCRSHFWKLKKLRFFFDKNIFPMVCKGVAHCALASSILVKHRSRVWSRLAPSYTTTCPDWQSAPTTGTVTAGISTYLRI